MNRPISICCSVLFAFLTAFAENAGMGSYLTAFPGTDNTGRNSFPPGSPQTSGKASLRPAPTNEWYSNELISAHGDGIFNYPMALKPLDNGLAIIRNMEQQAITAENPFVVSVEGMNASKTTVSDFSDWTVTINWEGQTSSMEATIGQGMPMVYFTRSEGAGKTTVSINAGTFKLLTPNIAIATGCYNRSAYAVYAPSGSTWDLQDNTISSDLSGKNYWTVAMLPEDVDFEQTARKWAAYAFAFPVDTRAEWNYDAKSAIVETTYTVNVDVKEGDKNSKPLIGLLPHHWANLVEGNLQSGSEGVFRTVRGDLRLTAASSFATQHVFYGIPGFLPAEAQNVSGYDIEDLKKLVDHVCDKTGFADWTDSYNDGQLLNRLSQTAIVARQAGYTQGAERAVALLKKQLEKWFVADPGDVAFVFYYHEPWNTMLAYPAGHGQDSNLNDHNFHFGYFIDAASTVALFDPKWAESWGPMVDLLAADIANIDRNSDRFPYLRSFSPFSGHCWANGFATLGLGNDQESSSESMMSHAALIKWAELRGNMELRDAAIWMFVTEMSAIEEYWFDVNQRNRPASFPSALVSRNFANGYDDENFWGGGIAGSYGIQIYPIQASSTYLVRNKDFANRLWDSMCSRTDILRDSEDPNIWYDSWAQYLSMIRLADALGFYNRNKTKMGDKFGISPALTYYWIHTLAAIGVPNFDVTADYPLAHTYVNGDVRTYVATNYSPQDIVVHFSDGQILNVPAHAECHYTDGDPEIAKPSDPEPPGGNEDDEDPEIPVDPGRDACSYTGTEASEGVFQSPYTIGFLTMDNDKVRISAGFGDESNYIGFAGPWLFNETNGFTEVDMKKTGEGRYETILTGLSHGDEIKIRVKIAFAGGLAVTRQYTYVVGSECEGQASIMNQGVDKPIEIILDGKTLLISNQEPALIDLYAPDGKRVGKWTVQPGNAKPIKLDNISSGVYLLRMASSKSNFNQSITVYLR